jgi:hypothetical protein
MSTQSNPVNGQSKEYNELLAKYNALKAAADAKSNKQITFHVSDATGVIMIRGLGRFPLSMYFGQWTRFISVYDKFRAFLEQVKEYVPQSKEEGVDLAKLAKLPAGIVVTPAEKAAS